MSGLKIDTGTGKTTEVVNTVTKPAERLAEEYAEYLQMLCDDIDIAAGEARGRHISPGEAITEEYTIAAAEAEAWDAAGKPDPAPPTVQSWATSKEWTAADACADILAAKAQLTGLVAYIREIRLTKREAVKNAATLAEAQTIAGKAIELLGGV